ncbi:MAG: hypothetical protein JNJ46_13210 [Myxococcales bacterium]|nr:hypothetical protein [Myxococcales bacterium]
MPDWRYIGPHRYFAEDNFLHWEPHGQVLPPHAEALVRVVDAMGARKRHVYCLFDQRDLLPLLPESRRRYVEYAREARPHVTIAFVTTSFLVRTVNRLGITGARLVAGYDLHHATFNTLEEAVAYLLPLRAA